jgi:hypothetical protein
MKQTDPERSPNRNPEKPSRDRSDREPRRPDTGQERRERGYDYDLPKKPKPQPIEES